MKIDIQLAESLLEAFNHEETGILLWDKNDKLIFRNDFCPLAKFIERTFLFF